ncbi:hypothetical protein QQ045_022392 [Rhodiola kirilowii]
MKNTFVSALPVRPLIALLILLFVSSSEAAAARGAPRLGVLQGKNILDNTHEFSGEADYKTYYYNQTLDHFNYLPESYATFKQKYVKNIKYWGGRNESAPIFVYLGAEAHIGFMSENAEQFKALLVYIEDESMTCYETIKQSWDEMDRIASLPGGLAYLSQTFNTCR